MYHRMHSPEPGCKQAEGKGGGLSRIHVAQGNAGDLPTTRATRIQKPRSGFYTDKTQKKNAVRVDIKAVSNEGTNTMLMFARE